MTEAIANQALNSYYENQLAEKQRWEKKLAPVKPRIAKAQQKKISLFRRIFSV